MSESGRSPFNDWLLGLRDLRARARIRARLNRVKLGNLGDYVSIGDGLWTWLSDVLQSGARKRNTIFTRWRKRYPKTGY